MTPGVTGDFLQLDFLGVDKSTSAGSKAFLYWPRLKNQLQLYRCMFRCPLMIMCSHNWCSVVYIRGVLDPFFVGFRHHRVINNAKANLRETLGGCGFVAVLLSMPGPLMLLSWAEGWVSHRGCINLLMYLMFWWVGINMLHGFHWHRARLIQCWEKKSV